MSLGIKGSSTGHISKKNKAISGNIKGNRCINPSVVELVSITSYGSLLAYFVMRISCFEGSNTSTYVTREAN